MAGAELSRRAKKLVGFHVNVVSDEEASLGVAEFWRGDRMIGFTLADGVVLGAHALAEANRLLALSRPHK